MSHDPIEQIAAELFSDELFVSLNASQTWWDQFRDKVAAALRAQREAKQEEDHEARGGTQAVREHGDLPQRATGDPSTPVPDLQWTLDNIYTIARRKLRRLERDLPSSDRLAAEEAVAWGHVLRLCEKAGCQSRGVLRDNGGSV